MRNSISFLVILLVLLGAVSRTAAEGESDSDEKDKAILSVQVVLPDKAIPAQTRVRLPIKIRNISDKDVNLPWPKFIDQFIRTESTAQDKTVLTVQHVGGALGHGKYPGGDVKPGGEITVEVWHIFPDVGRHTLRCVLETSRKATPWWSFWEGRVESKPVSVEVKPSKDG
jgi:hypothetical protein